MKKIITLSSIFSIFFIFTFNVFAIIPQTTPAFTIKYDRSETKDNPYISKPNSTVNDHIFLKNLDSEKTLRIILSTKKDTPSNNNKTNIEIPEEWFHFSQTEAILRPLESKKIDFKIDVPENANIKEYSSIIQATLIDYQDSKESKNKIIKINVGIAKSMNLIVANKITTNNKHKSNNISLKERLKNIYNFFQTNIQLTIIFVIIALLIKIILKEKN